MSQITDNTKTSSHVWTPEEVEKDGHGTQGPVVTLAQKRDVLIKEGNRFQRKDESSFTATVYSGKIVGDVFTL